jgi:hypothetical protein
MNLYLHYGVGHKQSMLRSNDQAKSNTEQIVKYNLYSRTRKHPKQKLSSEESTTGDSACRTRASTGRSLEDGKHHKPLNSTKHGNRDGTWPSRVAQGVKNTMARDDHAPFTGELSGRSKQRQNRRTTTNKAGGRVSTIGRRNRADLALKNDKNWSMPNRSTGNTSSGLSPSGTSLECFLAKNK